jgi:hypothetical protein
MTVYFDITFLRIFASKPRRMSYSGPCLRQFLGNGMCGTCGIQYLIGCMFFSSCVGISHNTKMLYLILQSHLHMNYMFQ